ncbi:G-PROTEIN-RECEP-F1-2 domain-containing protein [Aphelenchoides fujianensis]|nr:G-PROTEIN-RECEP-F1-2 domain-containing protein [Aphelenchoides fujianensis]
MEGRPHANFTCPPVAPPLSESYVHFSQLVNGFLTTLCVVLGTFGNLHSVKSVHFANFDKNRGIVLAVSILALAFWDTILLWCAFLYYGLKNLARSPHSDFVNLTTPYVHGFSQIANTASIWCVVSITVQRYLATRDPFRTTRWLLQFTSAEIKEYAGRRPSRRHHRVLLNSFRSERRKTSLSLLYCTLYRKHFKLPFMISFVAVLINIPAFFEIRTVQCIRLLENRVGYMLQISPLRLHHSYRLWYKVVFRMIVTTSGPNLVILLLTIRTIMLLRGSNRSRKNLFQMSESLIERYSSKATMLTLISVMLVVKFLTFRSLSFMLDIWEQAVGFGDRIHTIIYLVDTSNFLILLNSATNCFIIFRFSKWLQQKIVQRNTMKREKQICVDTNVFNSVERINLIHRSWQQLLFVTGKQVGARVFYAMILANPQVFALFREISKCSQNGTPVMLNHCQFRPMRDRKVVRISSARFESISTSAEADTPPAHERSAPPELPEAVERGEEEALVGDSTFIPIDGVDSPPADPLPPPPTAAVLPPPETIRRMSVEFASNRMFRKISEQITQFLGDLIDEMHAGQTEAQILLKIRKLGDLHYEKGICIPPTAWRDFKLAMMTMLTQCEYSSPHERTMVMEAWNSFLAIFIREMKLSMLGAGEAQHPLVHKHSTTNVPVFERSALP